MFSLLQRLSQELAQVPLGASNGTSAATQQPLSALGVSDLASLWTFIASLGLVRDWIKLFFLGTLLETIRRFAGSAWSGFLDSFFLSATFESDDDACMFSSLVLHPY